MIKFIKSASSEQDWINDDKVEFCFIGRSNTGKSTLINTLANNKISKTSKTPGRTQLVNFFDFNNFRIIDLPGYGFSKISKKKQDDIIRITEQYLLNRKNLFAIFQLCDANVITPLDAEMSVFFQKKFKNHFIILNKIDKQSISRYKNNLSKIANFLHVSVKNIILISAKNKTNINQVISKMVELSKI